jgi:hypothetical protein
MTDVDFGIDFRIPTRREILIWDHLRPEYQPSPEDRVVLGKLAEARTEDASPVGFLDGIYRCVTTEMQDDLASSDPLVRTNALCAICRAYELLCNAGYKEFLPLHNQLQVGLRRLAMTGRKVLTRKLLSPTTTDEQADGISQFLVDMTWQEAKARTTPQA